MEMMKMPATNKKVSLFVAQVLEMSDSGKIRIRSRNKAPTLSPMQGLS